MSALHLVIAPDPIFKQKAAHVDKVDSNIQEIMDGMLATLKAENGIGIAANMVGILKRIVVIDFEDAGKRTKLFMVNPEIIEKSDETQKFLEASLCFPGISADVNRPKYIKASYLDYDGKPQQIEAEGFLATCIQHEIDYLDGKTFLDYQSNLKKNTLIRKMNKYKKMHHGHSCGSSCSH